MSSIATIKNEREFYRDFYSLINVLKTIAISQFHALERKIHTYEELIKTVENFLNILDLESVPHPFANPGENAPLGIVAITSDKGFLGGLNSKIMNAAFGYMQDPKNQLVIVGQQGQNYVHGMNVFFKGFLIGEDNERYLRALQIRDHIMDEVLSGRVGPVKVIYPYAESIQVHHVMEMDLLPCTKWLDEDAVKWNEYGEDLLLESHPADLVEYLVHVSMSQKLFEILQFARLAEYAARTVHLEESTEKIKELDKKLELKYFRARHEVIDQQLRELFTARTLFADEI